MKEKVGGRQLCKETKNFPFPHYKTNSPPFLIPLFPSKNFPSPLEPFLKKFIPSLYERGRDGGSLDYGVEGIFNSRSAENKTVFQFQQQKNFYSKIVVSAPQITPGKSCIPTDVFQCLDISHWSICNFVVVNVLEA